MLHLTVRQLVFLAFCCLMIFSKTVLTQDKVWREVTQEELQMKTPKVEADADAEAIFWEVRVNDDFVPRAGFKTLINHYLRIKIFTERGRELNSKVDIPFGKIPDLNINVLIKDIAARTIKPDGTIIELKPEDIFERDTVKANGVKLKAKSFAMPGIETGAIIEYRWREIRGDSLSYYVRLPLMREIPVHLVKYYIKPVNAPNFYLGMRVHSFNVQNGFEKDKDNYYSMTMRDVPAFREEPRMPSEYTVKSWMLVYYADPLDDNGTAEKYWKTRAKNTFEYHKPLLKPDSDVRQITTQTIGNATDAEEKIRKIFDFCRKNIKDVDDDASPKNAEERAKIKPNKDNSETLKRRAGDWHDMNMLFGAMLAAAGFDVRVALAPSRFDAKFDKDFTNDYLLRLELLAVKVGNDWRFFDMSNYYLPYGMIPAFLEGQEVLISDSDALIWSKTPISSPDLSMEKRTAKLRLSEDGTLEGDVRIEFTGHLGNYYKEFNDDDSPTEREKTLNEIIKRNILDTAEISGISVENVQDVEKPFAYSFKIRIPNYAERTGKRLFVRPNLFERNTNALFTTNIRKYDISFDYAWSEDDEISIELPPNFIVESAETPSEVRDNRGFGSHETKISFSEDKRTLIYKRKFAFGNNGNLSFYKVAYPAIKQLFETFHKADAYSVSLKQN